MYLWKRKRDLLFTNLNILKKTYSGSKGNRKNSQLIIKLITTGATEEILGFFQLLFALGADSLHL
jgi:hypothetical protein